MKAEIWIYIAIMAGVTYLIRVLPMLLLRKKIENRFLRSFLYYVPYSTLAAMTFPAILSVTDHIWAGALAFAISLIFAYRFKSLPVVAVVSCVTALACEAIARFAL